MEVITWGWSSQSPEDARQVAKKRAQKIFEGGFKRRKEAFYDYGETPLREEVIERYSLNNSEYAVLTRNRYGALILNTAQVFFLDIDFPPIEAKGIFDFVLTALSNRRKQEREESREESIMDQVKAWFKRNPSRSGRIYRTKAGLRILFTDRLYDPGEETVTQTFEELQADPLYQQLTSNQKIFRARVSPKPWRMGLQRIPCENHGRSTRNDWLQQYHQDLSRYSVVTLRETLGAPSSDHQILEVIRLHDALAVTEGKTLA